MDAVDSASPVRGKLCLITGSSSGIGKATAAELARLGARVVIAGPERGETERALEDVRAETGSDELESIVGDFSTRAGVLAFAAEAARRFPRIDVLHNNAGVLCHDHRLGGEGVELTWAVNYFAPFLLTHLLLDQVAAARQGRIINTASVAHRWGNIHLDRLHEPRAFGVFNYFDTKLALVMFTRRLATRLPTNVTCNCLHPGIIGTNLAISGGVISALMRVGTPLMKHPRRGARTPVHLASAPALAEVSGEYFVDHAPRRPSRRARNEALVDALWKHSREVTGV